MPLIAKVMGKLNSKYSRTKSLMKELRDELNLSSEKVMRKWYSSYMRSYPSGQINEKEFISIYQKFFPQGDVEEFATHVFRAFGGKKKGYIGFKEFFSAFVVQSSGDLHEKVKFAFRMYDLDGDGEITRDEMLTIVRSIYKLFSPSVSMPEHLETPEKRTESIFNKMDSNKDGSISFDEFLEGAMHDSFISKMLGGSLNSSPTPSLRCVN